jgi:hypothetical protein
MDGGLVFMPGVPGFPPGAFWAMRAVPEKPPAEACSGDALSSSPRTVTQRALRDSVSLHGKPLTSPTAHASGFEEQDREDPLAW